jgi:hypothetical protein
MNILKTNTLSYRIYDKYIIAMELNNIVQEEIKKMINESSELLGLAELGEYLSRVDPNLTLENTQGILQQEYQQGGDEAVRKFFYEQSNGIDLQILGRGKYAFKY